MRDRLRTFSNPLLMEVVGVAAPSACLEDAGGVHCVEDTDGAGDLKHLTITAKEAAALLARAEDHYIDSRGSTSNQRASRSSSRLLGTPPAARSSLASMNRPRARSNGAASPVLRTRTRMFTYFSGRFPSRMRSHTRRCQRMDLTGSYSVSPSQKLAQSVARRPAMHMSVGRPASGGSKQRSRWPLLSSKRGSPHTRTQRPGRPSKWWPTRFR